MTTEDGPAPEKTEIVPEVLPVEFRLSVLEGHHETMNKRLEEMQKTIEEIPDVLKAYFVEYDKRVLARSGGSTGAGAPSWIKDVAEIVKTFTAPEQGTDTLSGLAKEIVEIDLRGIIKQAHKHWGTPDHVVVKG